MAGLRTEARSAGFWASYVSAHPPANLASRPRRRRRAPGRPGSQVHASDRTAARHSPVHPSAEDTGSHPAGHVCTQWPCSGSVLSQPSAALPRREARRARRTVPTRHDHVSSPSSPSRTGSAARTACGRPRSGLWRLGHAEVGELAAHGQGGPGGEPMTPGALLVLAGRAQGTSRPPAPGRLPTPSLRQRRRSLRAPCPTPPWASRAGSVFPSASQQ